ELFVIVALQIVPIQAALLEQLGVEEGGACVQVPREGVRSTAQSREGHCVPCLRQVVSFRVGDRFGDVGQFAGRSKRVCSLWAHVDHVRKTARGGVGRELVLISFGGQIGRAHV